MSLSACNPDRGPEYTTPAEFGEVTVSPQIMSFDSEVRVKVSVSCPYGLRNVCILYMLDGDESDVRTVAKTEPPADVTSFDYEGVIPRQRAGRKVTFRIRAITAYNVPPIRSFGNIRFPTKRRKNPNNPFKQRNSNFMELKEILAISGQPGLYKFVAQSVRGVIVESLLDGRRMNASANAKVSALSEISMFTEGEDIALADVFTRIYAHTGGKEAISPKESPEKLKAAFAEVLPEYDRDRVHVSDIKKCFAWYNTLVGAGFTEFKLPAENE